MKHRTLKVALGADHRGFELKEQLKSYLESLGHRVADLGIRAADYQPGIRVDYPDYAYAVARRVSRHQAQRGVLVCATGIGMAIAANKVKGVRAALCLNEKMARLSREHNDANLLCLGADLVSPARAKRIVAVWLGTGFAGGRHRRRVAKLNRYPEC